MGSFRIDWDSVGSSGIFWKIPPLFLHLLRDSLTFCHKIGVGGVYHHLIVQIRTPIVILADWRQQRRWRQWRQWRLDDF